MSTREMLLKQGAIKQLKEKEHKKDKNYKTMKNLIIKLLIKQKWKKILYANILFFLKTSGKIRLDRILSDTEIVAPNND